MNLIWGEIIIKVIRHLQKIQILRTSVHERGWKKWLIFYLEKEKQVIFG